MGALEEQARFLTAKYGTAAGPVGLPREATASTFDPATLMVIVGLLLFAVILFILVRDWQLQREINQVRQIE